MDLSKTQKMFAALAALIAAATAFSFPINQAGADYRFSDFQGKPPVHIYRAAATKPQGERPHK